MRLLSSTIFHGLCLAAMIGACGGPASQGASGAVCFRDDECEPGLVCVELACSSDLGALVSFGVGPEDEPMDAGGDASAEAAVPTESGVPPSGGSSAGGSSAGGSSAGGSSAGGSSAGGTGTAGSTTGGSSAGGSGGSSSGGSGDASSGGSGGSGGSSSGGSGGTSATGGTGVDAGSADGG